jgi:hypothetical protein
VTQSHARIRGATHGEIALGVISLLLVYILL